MFMRVNSICAHQVRHHWVPRATDGADAACPGRCIAVICDSDLEDICFGGNRAPAPNTV